MSPRPSSKGKTGIPGRNISSRGRKHDLKICPEAETICPKMTIRPLDDQARSVFFALIRAGLAVLAPIVM